MQISLDDADTIRELRDLVQGDERLWRLATAHSVEAAGAQLGRRVEPNVENFSGGDRWWKALKAEIFAFLCTADPRYAKLREEIEEARVMTRKLAVPTVAVVMATVIGVPATIPAAAILTPFVALALLGASQLGVQAWCAGQGNGKPSAFVSKDGQPLRLPGEQGAPIVDANAAASDGERMNNTQ